MVSTPVFLPVVKLIAQGSQNRNRLLFHFHLREPPGKRKFRSFRLENPIPQVFPRSTPALPHPVRTRLPNPRAHCTHSLSAPRMRSRIFPDINRVCATCVHIYSNALSSFCHGPCFLELPHRARVLLDGTGRIACLTRSGRMADPEN